MDLLIDSTIEVDPEEKVKRPRGRPRKEKVEVSPTLETITKIKKVRVKSVPKSVPKSELEEEPVEKRRVGRPRIHPIREKPLEKMKPGKKTNLSMNKSYFREYYQTHYKGVKITCPICNNPDIAIDKLQRHIKTRKCIMAEFLKKYPCPNDDEDDGVLEV